MSIPKKAKFLIKIIISLVVLLGLGTGWIAYHYYNIIYQPNVTISKDKPGYFYIPTGSSFEDVTNSLYEEGFIINRGSFDWVAKKKKYHKMVKPGKYLLEPQMSNNALVNLLRSGSQKPVQLKFNNIRLKHEIASQAAKYIEADSSSILEALNNTEIQKKYGFNEETIITMFIPNTYEFYWNTSANQFLDRMAKEYKVFWNKERIRKAKSINLSQSQVSTLASIVQKETQKTDEKPRVAEVYLNRLEKGMLLQADPTLIYALGDFTVHRVLNKHKKINSPYNTYLYKGLPPGPICLPEISSIDAVLNHESHDYLYFCAKEDFSGYHNFAKTYAQHRVNARKWQRELNARRVYR